MLLQLMLQVHIRLAEGGPLILITHGPHVPDVADIKSLAAPAKTRGHPDRA